MIVFTSAVHKNSKEGPTEVVIPVPRNIFYVYESSATKCTTIVSTGGAYLPVVEPKAEVLKRIREHTGGSEDGTKPTESTDGT